MTTTGPRTVVGAGPPDPRDVVPKVSDVGSATDSWGSRSMLLRIGSLAFELTGLDERLANLIRAQYEGFVAGIGGEPTANLRHRPVGLEIVRSPRPAWLHLSRGEGRCEDARVGASSHPSGLLTWSYFFAGWIERDGLSSRLVLCDAADLDISQAIENHLRFLVATTAVREGGFLLHSAGIIRGGKAYLFFGPSGAGKSTAAANAPPDAVHLGDDLVLVEPWRDAFRAAGVPFRGTFEGPTMPSATAPIAMACRLIQSQDVRLEEVSRGIQAAEVLGELPFLLEDDELQALAAERVASFIAAVPVRRLYLRADESHWKLLPS